MTLTSPIFALSTTALALALGWLVSRYSSFYVKETRKTTGGRYETLDGLRGFLAFGVFLCHVLLSFQWYQTGKWGAAGVGYAFIGGYAVSMFFMITGFLFWGKMLAAGGRPNWKALYLSRVRRLVPLYLFSVLLVLAVVALQSNFELRVGLRTLARQVSSWLTFSLIEPMDVNGLRDTERINGGVLWTLAYEWKFYLSLPLMAFFTLHTRFLLLGVCIIGLVWASLVNFVVIYFLFGMITAHATRTQVVSTMALAKPMFSGVAICLLLGLFAFGHVLSPATSAVLLFGVFFLIAHGNSLFGLLKLPAARLLGMVSYSMYLLHGIFLYIGLSLMNRFYPIVKMTPLEYWALTSIIAAGIVLSSAITYRCIEHPFILKPVRN